MVFRVSDDVRKCVCFLGFESPGKSGAVEFLPQGTGFWMNFDNWSHLVTCRHVAKNFEKTPFVIRANSVAGEADIYRVEQADWFYHPDESVDVAVIPAGLNPDADWRLIPKEMALTGDLFTNKNIGTGNLTHTVGLYRLLVGSKRNLPIVHSGTIAMMPGEEKIPMKDRNTGKISYVEAYLVESQSLDGLSGSPVFCRFTWEWQPMQEKAFVAGDIGLLGMWQASWDGYPGEVLGATMPKGVTVPVGIGAVVPAQKILDVLAMKEMQESRDQKRAEYAARNAATTQGVAAHTIAEESEPSTKDGDERSRERFTALLGEAAKKKPQAG